MHRLDRLAFDEIAHHERRAVAHLERPLSDLDVAATGLQRFDLRRQRVAGDDDQLAALHLVHDLVGDLGIGLRRELRPAAFEHEGVEIRIGRKVSAICWLARSAWSLV